jgi:hypothetical protein
MLSGVDCGMFCTVWECGCSNDNTSSLGFNDGSDNHASDNTNTKPGGLGFDNGLG